MYMNLREQSIELGPVYAHWRERTADHFLARDSEERGAGGADVEKTAVAPHLIVHILNIFEDTAIAALAGADHLEALLDPCRQQPSNQSRNRTGEGENKQVAHIVRAEALRLEHEIPDRKHPRDGQNCSCSEQYKRPQIQHHATNHHQKRNYRKPDVLDTIASRSQVQHRISNGQHYKQYGGPDPAG